MPPVGGGVGVMAKPCAHSVQGDAMGGIPWEGDALGPAIAGWTSFL